MSGRLVGEVIDWLQSEPADGITLAEAAVLMAIAERAHEKTREMWRHRIDDRSLYERIKGVTRQGDAGLSKTLQRLAARGLECRVPIATGSDGRPVFAARGKSMRFRLPELPAAVALPEPVDNGPSPVDNPPAEPVDNPPEDAERADVRPGFNGKGGHTSGLSPRKGRRTSAPNPSSTYPSTTDPSYGVRSLGAEVEGGHGGTRDPTSDLHLGDGYAEAHQALARLPDLGAALIEQARTELPGATLRELVIHAAAKGVPA